MPDTTGPFHISNTFVALDDACRARPLPVTADFWPALTSGRLGKIPRLIASCSYDADWPSWEKHPAGEEFVCLLEGEVELVLERDGAQTRVVLDQPGSYVLVPPDMWHTAKVRRPSRILFVTAGEGTLHRPA